MGLISVPDRENLHMTESRKDTDLIMVVTSDIAGQLRGKAMPHGAREERSGIGVGWTPTNIFQTSLGPIADTPWGAIGDLVLRPDFSTLVDLVIPEYAVDECFVIGDVLTLDGQRWECCLRGQLAGEAELFEISVSRFPQSLAEALDGLADSDWARSAFGDTLVDAYLRHKRCEVDLMKDLCDEEICARYGAVY